MTNWDYAQMAHDASLLGGPEQYISSIRDAGFIDGVGKGAAAGTAVTAIIAGLAFLGYKKIQERKALAAAAEEALLEAISDDGSYIVDDEPEND